MLYYILRYLNEFTVSNANKEQLMIVLDSVNTSFITWQRVLPSGELASVIYD